MLILMGGKGRGAESNPGGGREGGEKKQVCAHRWAFVSFPEAAHQVSKVAKMQEADSKARWLVLRLPSGGGAGVGWAGV